ncbi:HD domain-containing protein [Thermoproteota archaeon]
MVISFEEALILIKDSSKYEHSLLVSRIMKALAQYFDEPEQVWVLVGLLHDLDYDTVTDFSIHGIKTAEQLENKLPSEALHAIQAHDHRTSVKPETLLDEALIFADSLELFLDLKVELNEKQPIFTEKPWLWSNLTKFPEKHNIDVLELIEQLVI